MFAFAFTLIVMVGYYAAYRTGVNAGREEVLRQWEDWVRKQNGGAE